MDKALALAEQTLLNDPENIDVLMVIIEFRFAHEDHPKVVSESIRAIDVLEKRARPASLSDEEWQKKKTQLLGSVNYMGGVSSSLSGQYSRGDQMLRAAPTPSTGRRRDPGGHGKLYFLGFIEL